MNLKKTPLYSEHLRLGAKLAPFAGYEMPISYDKVSGGMKKEHLAVRQGAGMFDVSHMGEFWVEGKQAVEFLNKACSRGFSSLANFRAQYCLLLQPDGGIIDDILVYRLNSEKFWVVVNAANIEKDWKHLKSLASEYEVELNDVSEDISLIAIQGPKAALVCDKLLGSVSDLKYYGFKTTDKDWIVGRTGYTGEDGFEVFLPNSEATPLWKSLEESAVVPIGLGARDSLRLEAGFPLYGHELSSEIKPQESFSWFACKSDHDFVGKKGTEDPARFKPIGLVGHTPKPIRQGEKIVYKNQVVGEVTSGAYSPELNKGIGLGLLEISKLPKDETEDFFLESGGKQREVTFESPPFVETGRAKKRKKN